MPVAPPTPSPAEQCVERMLLSRLGWPEGPGGKVVYVHRLSVKDATYLQLGHVRHQRRARHMSFVQSALGSQDEAVVEATLQQLLSLLSKLWRCVKWDNLFKEVYWRMLLNGLPTAARMHLSDSKCLCGVVCPDLKHHYWDCPIAQSVVQVVSSQLSPTWCSRSPDVCPLKQHHVWLMQPPAGPNRLHATTWLVVCLAAINAMDGGRRAANKFIHDVNVQQATLVASLQQPTPQALPVDQPPITAFFSHAPLSTAQLQHNQVVQVRRDTHQQRQQEMLQQQIQQQAMGLLAEAKQSVVMEFWRLLADFVALNPCPAHGFDTLPHQHPFMCLDDANCLKLVPFPP